jgi:hypothetical protein
MQEVSSFPPDVRRRLVDDVEALVGRSSFAL